MCPLVPDQQNRDDQSSRSPLLNIFRLPIDPTSLAHTLAIYGRFCLAVHCSHAARGMQAPSKNDIETTPALFPLSSTEFVRDIRLTFTPMLRRATGRMEKVLLSSSTLRRA
ncbi:hypothetical protein JCM11251_006352 [Rhodosporidiobolus azoricus]